MDVYIAFTDKEKLKIDEWKKELPKLKKGHTRSFSIHFHATETRNKDNHQLFKTYFKSSDGHKLFVTKKSIMH